MKELIISVESRKGGVGKTTAALCLANLLRKNEYAVLFLDLDVTGTNAADFEKSPFWKGSLNVIKENNKKTSTAANFITLFERCFMTGKQIPSFSSKMKGDGMYIDLEKVNVLGSQIFITNCEKNNSNIKTGICIDKPSILFDELHGFWLLEFVKQIIDNFSNIVAQENKLIKKVAVILDNSPGYVGLSPAINEWLTDRGPEASKFLTVMSLDTQDIQSCKLAIDNLHIIYVNKWEASRKFIEAINGGSEINIDKKHETFFIRLASTSSKTNDPLEFFRQTPDNIGKLYSNTPSMFMATLINRVPRSIKRNYLTYDIQGTGEWGSASNQLIIGNNREISWRDRIVSYDEYIENQFSMQLLQRGGSRSQRQIHYLVDNIEMYAHKLNSIVDVSDGFMTSMIMDFNHFKSLRRQLVGTNDILINARSALEDAGLWHLSRLIHDEWLPGSIVPSFKSSFIALLREGDFPYFEKGSFEFDTSNDEAQEFVRNLPKRILVELNHYYDKINVSEHDIETAEELAIVLSYLVGVSLTSPLWHSPLKEEVSEMLALVLFIELKHWAKRKDRKHGLEYFLAQEKITHKELHSDLDKFMHNRFFRHSMMEEKESTFTEFYSACTSAQARLIDFVPDSKFLLDVIQVIVKNEIQEGKIFPYVKGIAEEVIIRKTISHEDAPDKMAKAIQTEEYYKEFESVLISILKEWGLEKWQK